MYRGKRYKRTNKKPILLLVSMILVLTVAVGGSLAYLVTQTGIVQNSFTVQQVPIEINETFNGKEKSNVTIKNISDEDGGTGDPGTDAYIRAAVVANWVDKEGNVYGQAPEFEEDYVFKTPSKMWILSDDGYYYYKEAVEAGESTEVLMDTCISRKDAPVGYTLSVEILAQSIQANGPDGTESAIYKAWGASAARVVGEVGFTTPDSLGKSN